MKDTLIRKLSSRKLWAALVGVVTGLAAAFGIDQNEYAEIAGIVTSAASVLAYLFAESSVDKANAQASAPTAANTAADTADRKDTSRAE